MIFKGTKLNVCDNSGAKVIQCIGFLGRSDALSNASAGDVIVVAVKSAIPNSKVKKGSIQKALIVRVKSNLRRKDGVTSSFCSNSAVLINNSYMPIGTRVFGPVAKEVRQMGFVKVTSLADEII